MEKFKINSHELIESSGGNEKIFEAINSPDSHIFSLQRFAGETNNRTIQIGYDSSGSTTLLSTSDKVSDVLYDLTLGRSTDTSKARSDHSGSIGWGSSGTFLFAPLSWSDTTGNIQTYTFTTYQLDDKHTRIAVNGTFTAASSTGLGLDALNYWAGVALNSGTSVFSTNNVSDTSKFFTGDLITSGTNKRNAYTSYFGTVDSYTGLYFALGSSTGRLGTSVDKVFFSDTTMTYSLDFYDAKLGGPYQVAGTPYTNTYVVKLANNHSILFASDTTLNFYDVQGNESETYKLNDVNTVIQGYANSSTFALTASKYTGNSSTAQTFSFDSFPASSLSVQFSLLKLGSGTGVVINSNAYKSDNNSGTVKFGITSGTKFITLGDGGYFNLEGVGTETYRFADAGTGTFKFANGSTFTLNTDGDQYNPIRFIGGTHINNTSNTVTFMAGDEGSSSDVKIFGNFADIGGNTTDTSYLGGLRFQLQDSSTAFFANFGGFSDTQNGKDVYIEFRSDTMMFLDGAMSGTSVGSAKYTLISTDTTFALNSNVFYAKNAGNGTDNQFSFIDTSLTYSNAHTGTYAPVPLSVTGFDLGSNINMLGNITISQGSATLLGNLYVYNSSTSASATLSGGDAFSTATNLGNGTFIVSAVDDSNTLIGVSNRAFTTTGIVDFYLKDGGSDTSINGLTFKESSDGYVSKLAFAPLASVGSSVSVFGNVELTSGSDANLKYAYTLNPYLDGASTSSIAMNGLTFSGTGTSVHNVQQGTYTLTASNSSIFSIDGTLKETSSFTMLQQSAGSSFVFGKDSATAITFASSGTSTFGDNGVTAIFGAGTLHATNTATVAGGELHIKDAANSEAYTVLLGNSKVLGITDIDPGAIIYKVASATQVITTGEGLYTFTSTVVLDSTASTKGTDSQIFNIVGDADGVTFTLDNTGLVTGISGISSTAVVSITDLTTANSTHYWTKTGAQLGASDDEGGDVSWSNTAKGVWATDKYVEYIVQNSGTATAFTVYGVESDSQLAHTKLELSKVGGGAATTGSIIGLTAPFSASTTQISFINRAGNAISASDTTANAILFTNFASNTNMGLLYTSGTTTLQIATVPAENTSGSSTAISSLSAISDTVSLTLGGLALNAADTYAFSGTGVALSIDSSMATVSAGADNPAYVVLTDAAGINFGSTGTGVYNIYSGTSFATLRDTLSIALGSTNGAVASGTLTDDIFTMGLLNGASVTDTYYANSGDSSLTINDIKLAMIDSTTFAFTAGTTNKSDTLAVTLGQVSVASDDKVFGDFLGGTTFSLGASNTSLVLDTFSYTGVTAATFAVDNVSSGTQMIVNMNENGQVKEAVASGTAFVFNNSLFTAMGNNVLFQVNGLANGTSESLLVGSESATGLWNQEGDYTLNNMGSTTFTMQSGSTVVMSYDAKAKYNAAFAYQQGASGTFMTSTGGAFSLSDYYLTGGVSNTDLAKTPYSYTALQATTFSIVVGGSQGTDTVYFKAGEGSRTALSANEGFHFAPVSLSESGIGVSFIDYTTTSQAFTFKIDSGTAQTYGAQGAAWYGSATRLYAALGEGENATNFTSTTMYRTFNSDTKYLPMENALMTLNVINGVGSETFTSGTGVYTANKGDAFHFTLDGITHSYTSIQDAGAIFTAQFTNATHSGTLLTASGSGTRTAAAGDASIWTFGKNIGESYTALAGSIVDLNIGGVGIGTETITLGTATYAAAAGSVFHISDDYLSGTGLQGSSGAASSYTYLVSTGHSGTLTMLINGASQTVTLDSTLQAIRTDTGLANNGSTFSLNVDNIAGLSGTTSAQTFTAAEGALMTYYLDSGTAKDYGAVGQFYTGSGTRLYGGYSTDGSATSMFRTYNLHGTYAMDAYLPVAGSATMKVDVVAGQGTETFLSGTGTYTAAAGDGVFHFAIGENGPAYSYTAVNETVLNVLFDNANSSGKLLSASGLGQRLTSATESYVLMTYDSFTMEAGATKYLSFADGGANDAGLGLGSETFASGSGVFTASQKQQFNLSQWYMESGTNKDTASKAEYVYFASSTNVILSLGFIDNSETISIKSGFGTRDSGTATFNYIYNEGKADSATFTYSTTSTYGAGENGVGVMYKIDSGSKLVSGDLYNAVGTRLYAQTSSMLTPVTFGQGSDTYTPMNTAKVEFSVVDGVGGTETFKLGSATLIANTDGGATTFTMKMSGTSITNSDWAVYSATAAGATFTISKNEEDKLQLVDATGTALTTGEKDTYAISILSDSYIMGAGTIKEVFFSSTNAANTYAIVNDFAYTTGTGLFAVSQGSSFSVADAFILGSGTKPADFGLIAASDIYTYTATNAGSGGGLRLSIDGTNTKIFLNGVEGTRNGEAGEVFSFSNIEGNTQSTTITGYSATNLGLTYKISQAILSDGYSATGMMSSGQATRIYGKEGFTSTTMQRSFQSNTYLPIVGLATMTLDVADGVGTETFTSGSGTFTAGNTFWFKIGEEGTLRSYTNVADSVIMNVAFSDTTEASGKLYSVVGTGTRISDATDQANKALWTFDETLKNGNSFTMTAGATIMLQNMGVDASGYGTGSETYTSGTGTYNLNGMAGTGQFVVSQDYLDGATDTSHTQSYTYTAMSANGALQIALDGTHTTLSLINGLVGTRAETGRTTFDLYPNGANAAPFTYSTTGVDAALTYIINGDTHSSTAIGDMYSGKGTRIYNNQNSPWLDAITLKEDTYTLLNDALISVDFVEGAGTETYFFGSATFTAGADGSSNIFHVKASGTGIANGLDSDYTPYTAANGEQVVLTISRSGSSESTLVNVSGTAVAAGAGAHILSVLSSTYTMDATALKNLTFDGVEGTYALVTGYNYFSGTGTIEALGVGSSFAIADAFLGTGTKTSNIDNITDQVYTYTATALTTGGKGLVVTLDGTNTSIALDGLTGTRNQEGGTFTLSAINDYSGTETVTYNAIGGGVTFSIDSEIANSLGAIGQLASGSGTRIFGESNLAQEITTSSLYNTFMSDTKYLPDKGALITVGVNNGTGTELFTSGQGSYTAYNTSNDTFHFAIGGSDSAKLYTAFGGNVILTASFTSRADAYLIDAVGSGTRTGGGANDIAYKSFEGAGDSFTMAEDATIKLNILGVNETTHQGLGSETYVKGSGAYTVADGGYFTISQDYLDGATDTNHAHSYTYTALTDNGILGVNISGSKTTLLLTNNLAGLRTDTNLAANTTFAIDGITYTAKEGDTAAFYISKDVITTSDTKAEGLFYFGKGQRTLAEGGTSTSFVNYLSDTYSITAGTLTIDVMSATGKEELTSGSATWIAGLNNDKIFHYEYGNGTYAYTAMADSGMTLSVAVDLENATTLLYNASGTGTRKLADGNATTYAVSDLANNVYSFTGVVKLTVEGATNTAVENAFAGQGTREINGADGDTIIAQFDKDGNYSSTLTAYSYTSFSNATFTIGMDAGNVTSQTIINGSATRFNADDPTFLFKVDGATDYNTYSTTSVKESTAAAGSTLTFTLDNTSMAYAGAQGGLLDGFGFRAGSNADTYSDSNYANAIVYTLNENSEFKLTVEKGNGTESLFHADAVDNTYGIGTRFWFEGTQYTAQSQTTVMQLTATNGKATEKLASGSAIFNGTSSETTFTWDQNVYNVEGSATLLLSAGSTRAVFQKGTGVKKMDSTNPSENIFKYTDGNWYTATDTPAVLIAEGNSGAATVTFVSGTAVDDISDGKSFYFDLKSNDSTSNLYTAVGAVELGLSSTAVADADNAGVPKFLSGSGTRIAAKGAGEIFTFENREYTATNDDITWTIGLEEAGNYDSVGETVTSAEASTTLLDGPFTYKSPISGHTETYKVKDALILELTLKNNQGTETLKSGSGTRGLAQGDTFNLSPSNVLNLSSDMTFAATGGTTYQLSFWNDPNTSQESGLLFMGYNVDVVTETLIEGAGTGTLIGKTFGFETIVTGKTNTYTANAENGIVFNVVVDENGNTATWLSGSGTMKLDSGEFYYMPTNGASHTYTVSADGAGFLRTSETTLEFLTSGSGYRSLAETGDTTFTATYLNNVYTADAGAMVVLSNTGVGVTTTEGFESGTATFKSAGNENFFNFDPTNSGSHTYTGAAVLTLKVTDNFNGAGTYDLISATGTGVRSLVTGEETYTTTVIGNAFTANEGTYTLNLTGEATASETFLSGMGTYAATGKSFFLNDVYLNGASGTAAEVVYTYTAIGDATNLYLTIDNTVESSIQLVGAGTRTTDTGTIFSYTVSAGERTFTADGALTYEINSASETGAAGFLFEGVGTRKTAANEGGETVFNSDVYTVDEGAIMKLTVTNAEGDEVMTSGTATFVATASANDTFHFGTYNYNAYVSNTKLQIAFESAAASDQKLVFINGAGTRAADSVDAATAGMTYYFESDTYNAIAGSSTILFTATTDDTAGIQTTTSILGGTGSVMYDVSTTGIFHFDPTTNNKDGSLYEYTANSASDVQITLDVANGTRTFNVDPNATRTASETTFTYAVTGAIYTAKAIDTYSLTGTGTNIAEAGLTDAIFKASGYRTDVVDDTTTSSWNNTYILKAGTYDIEITDGTGEDTLTAGTGLQTYAVGSTNYFNYGDSSTAFTANSKDAVLSWSVGGNDSLISGAGGRVDEGTGTYIMAGTAPVTLDAYFSTDVTLNAVAGTDEDLGVVTLKAITFSEFSGGVNSFSASSLNVAFGDKGSIGVNGKRFEAAGATMTVNSGLDVFTTNGQTTISAEGDFATAPVTLSDDKLGITNDTDIKAIFNSGGVQQIEKLSDGVTVGDAAGATKAITDSNGRFIFTSKDAGSTLVPANENTQTFNITGDDAVTFQLDETTGLVTGIGGINSSNDNAVTVIIDDSNTSSGTAGPETFTLDKAGLALTRKDDGSWQSGEVVADYYIIKVESNSSIVVSAVDNTNTVTKVDNNRIGSISTADSAINIVLGAGDNANDSILTGGVEVYVDNKATDKVINVSGKANLNGIGYTSDTSAIELTTSTGIFNAGSLSDNAFTSAVSGYGVTNGQFSVASGNRMAVQATSSSAANVTMESGNSVGLMADSDTIVDSYIVNGGEAITLAIGSADTNGIGMFGISSLNNDTVAGLTPRNVQTGTANVATTNDTTTQNIFAIGDEKVTVVGDTDNNGMTLEIYSDALVGISNIATDATINVSTDSLNAGDTFNVDGTPVTLQEDSNGIAPIKYNTTKDAWTSGSATAIENAFSYLVTVNSDGNVDLYYTTTDDSDTLKQTTNKADYNVVFSNLAPENDGGTVAYGDGVIINGSIADTIKVSIAAQSGGISATMTEGGTKELALVTANGNYTINGQQIIPTSAINATATGNSAVELTLNSTVTVAHGADNYSAMNFTADTDSQILFASGAIYLHDTAKVTNTSNAENFFVTGEVAFDGIVVKSGNSSMTTVNNVTAVASLAGNGSGLVVDRKDLTVTGGDLNYTVDVTEATPTISGINGGSTLNGDLSSEAKIVTASTGEFKINESDPFTISEDSEVAFITSARRVVEIDSLVGTASGNFESTVTIEDSLHAVRVLNDTVVAVMANGTQVTDIYGVGSASTDVVVANAGGATIVSTDLNGSIYFGENGQHYNATDVDGSVSYLTSSNADFVPSVSGVTNLSNGSIAISQDESGFTINSEKISLGAVSNDVTVAVANSAISTVRGLEGSVNGLNAGVMVNAVDSDVTINGAVLQVVETSIAGGTNLTVEAIASGFDTVMGLNRDASVTTARNAHIITEEDGAFTFIGNVASLSPETYEIGGDNYVTFETDGDSRVRNIADFAGTLKSTADHVTVNGNAFATSNTDASIVSAGAGANTVVGLSDGDSVTVPNGTNVQIPGTTDSNPDTAITVNDKTYRLVNDSDGLTVAPTASGIDAISGLAPNASLVVGAAGDYNVNGSAINASIGATIIGDVEGSAHVYSPADIDFNENTDTDTIINKILPEDRYVEHLDTDASAALINAISSGNTSDANGNLQMEVTNAGTDTQVLNFSNTTGIKKVTLESGAQDVTFNDAGGNIAIVSSGVDGTKNINLGNGGDLAVVNDTGLTPVNIRTGRGKDTIVTKGRAVDVNMSAGGAARIMPTAGTVNVEGYDATTGAGIQLTNSNVALAVKTNSIKLQNGSATVNGGATVNLDRNAETFGSSTANFYNLKGLMTKVGWTHDDGGAVDMSTESGDVVLKGNYTEGAAQRKGGGSTLVSGSGNDTAFGGAGDAFDLGSGDNTITMDTDRSLSEGGARISQTATTGRTEVNNFHAEYGDTGDRVRIDTTQATVKFVGGALRFMLGAATMILNAVGSAISSDLGESADGEDSRIGTVHTQKVLVENSGDTSGEALRLEVASAGAVIDVERVDDVITQSYVGENSGVNLGRFDEDALINLATGEGVLGNEAAYFRGINKLQGGNGTNTLMGNGAENNTIVAGLGGGSVWGGGASNDTLTGVGNSLESIKSASTSFFFMNGDGKDQIQDFTFWKEDTADTADRINIHTSAVTNVDVAGNDVVIGLTNESDKLTIKDAIVNGVGQDFRMDFVDGNGIHNSLTAQVSDSTLIFDGRANYYQATGKNAIVSASSELSSAEIWLNGDGAYGNNYFVGNIKYLNASNVDGRSTLVGNSEDNVITASQDNTSMWGGDRGGNDILVGGSGADMFWYGKTNNGNDVITNIDGNDTVNLYDITIADINTAEIGSNEINITLKDTGNSLRVQGNITSGIGFRLANGETYTVDSTRNWVQK